MSSDEQEPNSPVVQRDSDRGSSVSSELQDEYEELLRYAVVTPKFEPNPSAQLQPLSADGRNSRGRSHHSAASDVDDGRLSSRSMRSQQEPASQGEEEMAGRSSTLSGAAHSDRVQTPSERSTHCSPDPLVTIVTDLFISEGNINTMGNILDTWSNNLKSNVLQELRQWRATFMEQHLSEMQKEKGKYDTEIDRLQGLVHTYETSNQRKDEVIMNLSQAVDKQRERLELMRTFTHWRLEHSEAKDEAHTVRLAERHYRLRLKRKVWCGWNSVVQTSWKEKVERACRARAEEVCVRLSTEYEAKIAEDLAKAEKAQAEIQRLRSERENYEESMKKAFMRGVCALNMEALSMFQTGEGRMEYKPPAQSYDAPPPRDDPSSGSLGSLLQTRPSSSTKFSPLHFDPPGPPYHSEAETGGPSAPASRAETLPSTTVVHSAHPFGAAAGSTLRQVGNRVVTSGQQKAVKTVTARISARSDLTKTPRCNLQVMGVIPPMSSVIVERHHPVTQATVGQAVAAKFPRSSQSGSHGQSGSKSSSRTHSSTCPYVQSIKVVE